MSRILKIFVYLAASLVAALKLLVIACRMQFSDQESNLGPLHWVPRVLATRPPGKSLKQGGFRQKLS